MKLDDFKNPSALYRNAPFWSWNDKIDKAELLRQMDEMKEKGWGSSFMHSRVGLVTDYLSEEWMELTRACANHAKENGRYVWLYDEDKWPSGFASGLVPEKNEAFRSRDLILLKKDQITEHDSIIKEYDSDEDKVYICKRVAPMGNVWFNGASYVDLMNPEVVKEFIACTHDRYKEECGDGFGKEIQGVFTDEPCYNMNNQYQEPTVPWSDYLPDYFEKQKGYDIIEHVEQLFFDIGDYQKIRFDFYDSAVRLFVSSFSEQYYSWCDKNNLKLTGHFMAEDNLISQTKWIGAAMPHYQFMHWPGIDKLMRNIEQLVTVKQLTSVADQLGKERALCEVFCCMGQHANFFHRKWISDWQAVLGISFVNPHLSLYSMRGERKRDYPPNLFVQQPWWEDERKYADYTARLCFAAVNGKREVDILVLHPIASVWSEYSPLHGGHNAGYNMEENFDYAVEKSKYDRPFDRLAREFVANKLDFHFGDEIIMEGHARVENGKLVVGKHGYSTVVVPPMLTVRGNTLKLLKEFAAQAGADRILFVRQLPSRVDGLEQELGLPKGTLKVRTVNEAVELLNKRYDNRIKIIDTASGKNAEKVICQQRSSEEGMMFLVANTEENRKVEVSISITSDKMPVLLDMMSGGAYSIPFNNCNGRVEFTCTLHAAGSMLIYFAENEIMTTPIPAYLGCGVEFKREYNVLDTLKQWKTNMLEENVLPLHDITLYVNGEKVLNNKHVAYAWHDNFYKLPEGTPFKAEYYFNVNSIPEGILTAVIEVAENLDRILVNGKETKPLKNKGELGAFNAQKSWKDVNFTKVPIQGLVTKGRNVITIEGKKINNITGPGSHRRVEDSKNYMPTEVETIYIVGQFSVLGEAVSGFVIDAPNPLPNAADVTKCGYPFYAGKVEFTTEVDVKQNAENIYLKLIDVEAASVKLFVNGQLVDLAYFKPFMFDITKFLNNGTNQISLIAANTLFNLMGPNWIADIDNQKWVATRDFINYKKFTDDYRFLPFGIGGVMLLEGK